MLLEATFTEVEHSTLCTILSQVKTATFLYFFVQFDWQFTFLLPDIDKCRWSNFIWGHVTMVREGVPTTGRWCHARKKETMSWGCLVSHSLLNLISERFCSRSCEIRWGWIHVCFSNSLLWFITWYGLGLLNQQESFTILMNIASPGSLNMPEYMSLETEVRKIPPPNIVTASMESCSRIFCTRSKNIYFII